MPNPVSNLVVRRATAADAYEISATLREAFTEFEARYTPAAFAATALSEQGVFARLREGPLWVVESESSIIGTVGARAAADAVTIRGMAVNSRARGLGVGRILLEQAEHFAAQQGARLIELYTTAFLESAIRLYRSAGFEFTGETICPHGTELLRMTKALLYSIFGKGVDQSRDGCVDFSSRKIHFHRPQEFTVFPKMP